MKRTAEVQLPGDAEGRSWPPVTSPLLPEWATLAPMLQDVLERRWLTNQGTYARRLEDALPPILGAPHVALTTNGTLALERMIPSSVAGGEVIVPAWSFPATWNLLADDPRYTPVFVDVGDDLCIDPGAVAAAITPRTTAILTVHACGAPCAQAALAAQHGPTLLYDAAHAFGVELDGQPLGALGDASAWSFHATKVFNTLEGGAVTTARPDLAARVVTRRNFGLGPEGQTVFGTNGKMDEFRAAVGLATLPLVPGAISARERIPAAYDERLGPLHAEGRVEFRGPPARPNLRRNHAYCPAGFPGVAVRTDAALRGHGILARRYFGRTLFDDPVYAGRIRPGDLPRAAHAGDTVLCLPIHHAMDEADVDRVCSVRVASLAAARP